MTTKKSNALKAIRRKAATQKRLTAPALANSAFDNLTRANRGITRPREDRDLAERFVTLAPRKPTKRAKQAKKVLTPKKKPTPPPATEPADEYWRPAGGEIPLNNHISDAAEDAAKFLAIARLSTWRLETFTRALRLLIDEYVDIERVLTKEIETGGEMLADVFVEFRDQYDAALVRERIDGVMVEGRRLRVRVV